MSGYLGTQSCTRRISWSVNPAGRTRVASNANSSSVKIPKTSSAVAVLSDINHLGRASKETGSTGQQPTPHAP